MANQLTLGYLVGEYRFVGPSRAYLKVYQPAYRGASAVLIIDSKPLLDIRSRVELRRANPQPKRKPRDLGICESGLASCRGLGARAMFAASSTKLGSWYTLLFLCQVYDLESLTHDSVAITTMTSDHFLNR